ncbi:MAG: hypothetical protein H0T78_02335 [Longispora sp.]|nr:hypothetical protein [Longispora sp. (in: high G+C Gram-positive bacteria)]
MEKRNAVAITTLQPDDVTMAIREVVDPQDGQTIAYFDVELSHAGGPREKVALLKAIGEIFVEFLDDPVLGEAMKELNGRVREFIEEIESPLPHLPCPSWCDGHPVARLAGFPVQESVHVDLNTITVWMEATDATREGERESVRIRIDDREGFGPATARNLAAWLVEFADELESDPDFQSTERDIDREWDREIRPAVPALW